VHHQAANAKNVIMPGVTSLILNLMQSSIYDQMHSGRNDIETLNKQFYASEATAKWWAMKKFVLPEEQSLLRDYGEEIKGKNILDVGIGGGRTTQFLLSLGGNYIGIDYSSKMVEEAKILFPGTRFELCDARNLSVFEDAQFDFVLFSFNGLDSLPHEGRMLILGEFHRVLKTGGLLAFTSHNRQRSVVKPWTLDQLHFSKHPFRMLRNLKQYIQGVFNWCQARKCLFEGTEYAIRLDSGNLFQAPLYYISKTDQVRQLEQNGFQMEAIYDGAGGRASPEVADTRSSWLLYVCRPSAL
jgi:ubiquinone/menaquinone biosynthesis C-methylase UbiE